MRAIDTNILVRFLTNDDKDQAAAARAVIAAGDILIPTTVLLEAEWVLRGAYGLGGDVIVAGGVGFREMGHLVGPGFLEGGAGSEAGNKVFAGRTDAEGPQAGVAEHVGHQKVSQREGSEDSLPALFC